MPGTRGASRLYASRRPHLQFLPAGSVRIARSRAPAVRDRDLSALLALAGPSFEIRESVDGDGALRVALIGELDIAVADAVEQRLRQHREEDRPVRLDLSQLDFIDSSGVQTVVLGVKRARQVGREFEVDRRVSPSVKRLIEMMGIGSQLWPHGHAAG
jgi:anti-anti-sigma factor